MILHEEKCIYFDLLKIIIFFCKKNKVEKYWIFT